MDILDDSNEEILSYFSKFKDNENYPRHFITFGDLTRFRVKRMIELEDLMLPDIGPSDKLSEFPGELKNWPQRDIAEVKTIIKLYDSGEIEFYDELIRLKESNKDDSIIYGSIWSYLAILLTDV